jgi:hypothetical protein
MTTEDLWPWYVEVERLRKLAARVYPDVTTTVGLGFQRGGLVDISVHAHVRPGLIAFSERIYTHDGQDEDRAMAMAARALATRVEAGQHDDLTSEPAVQP